MDFSKAVQDAASRADWHVEREDKQGERIIYNVKSYSGNSTQILVFTSQVASTWNTWDENKQQRGTEKLAAQMSRILSRVMPGMVTTLSPNDWTPDAA